jgi:tetrahydromethanopterin S-methyltransferase subunit G
METDDDREIRTRLDQLGEQFHHARTEFTQKKRQWEGVLDGTE